jgi:DNA-directed RNA polymerase subunit H (RpoH/RPB5)
MKNGFTCLFLTEVIFCVVGCNAQSNPAPPIARLQFGMQKYEVEEIYGKHLTFVSLEPIPDTNGYSKGVYRMWSNRPDAPKGHRGILTAGQPTPFKLTFVIYPPLTNGQCELIVAKNNVTDANEIKQIMALEGYRPNQLLKIEEDTSALMIEAVHGQTKAIIQESDDTTSSQNILTPNAYGLGVHSDRYGRPVKLIPDWGGVPGETLQIKPDAYGPGVHSDQYGRPVREYPWP